MRKGIPSFDELNPLTQILVIGLFGGLACILSGSGFMGFMGIRRSLPSMDTQVFQVGVMYLSS
jgi:hypothetical protein